MDVIEAIKNDKAYMKYKFIVKNWEKNFKLSHARTPSKFDIKEAPSNVKYAYKKYFQLKSEALENSLTVCDTEKDEIGSPKTVEHLNFVSDINPILDTETLLPTLPTGQELDLLLSGTKKQVDTIEQSPFIQNLSKRLFQNHKVSLRNPRKLPVIKSQSQCTQDIKDATHDEESSFKKLCGEKSENNLNITACSAYYHISENTKEKDLVQVPSEDINNINDFLNSTKVRQINKAWLERAGGLHDEELEKCKKNTNSTVEKFGLSNVSVVSALDKPCDYIENSESDEEDIVIKRLKPALKKRKVRNLDTVTTLDNSHTKKDFSDDDITQGKQSYDKKLNLKRNKKISIKTDEKVILDQPPNLREYMPFGLDEQINPRIVKINDMLDVVDSHKTENIIEPQGDVRLEKLEKKMQHGTINDNYVKINLEKKVYVRGRKNMNYSKYKKKLWKDKKALHGGMEFPESGKISCYKCGLTGHMARYCKSHKETTLLPLESFTEDDIPTLEDMEKVVQKESNYGLVEDELSACLYTASQIPEQFIKLLAETPQTLTNSDIMPIYTDENISRETIYKVLTMFGHESFKSGQEQAIMRILCGKSTLLVLSTGGGKSLCYQLPAFIYSQHHKCITLVISPLVSLMEDQVLSMPDFLKAGCLHTNQPPTQRRKVMELLKKGDINILLISPEALISGDSSQGFAGLLTALPKIAFACIDEAHCVSQWSHNFRPSYLMICRILREKLNVKCILGLTATASHSTIESIINHINIPDGLKGVIQNPTLPDNLFLSMSFEKNKDKALISFLTSKTVEEFNSIIVYCIRRNECERIAALIRSCLSEIGKVNMEKKSGKRKRMSYIAEAYHAGMSAAQRKKIQNYFMDGTLRIIVATVAFGMGINKADIRCILHYNMPASFESYVQEVGRAGRDGKSAYCHVFINDCNSDKNELLKHIYANSTDRSIIRRLLQKVFIPCQCSLSNTSNSTRCKGHEVGIPINSTVEELDLPSENIATLLCYIELHPKHYIKVLNNAYTNCKISSYGESQKILEAAKSCPPLAMAYLIESKKDPAVLKQNSIEFNVIETAAAIGWESGMTKYQLKNLEWTTVNGRTQRSQLKVELTTLGFRIKAPGDLTEFELDHILDDLHELVCKQEQVMLYQLEEIDKSFRLLSNYSVENTEFCTEFLIEKSNELKTIIRNYFQRNCDIPDNITLLSRPLDVERAVSDIRALLTCYKDCKFTGRSVARIFQGISSPNFPAIVWGKCKFWRSHIHEDFNGLTKIATQQIIQMQ